MFRLIKSVFVLAFIGLLSGCYTDYSGQEFAPSTNGAFVGMLNVPYDVTGIHVTTQNSWENFHVKNAQYSNILVPQILPPGKRMEGGCYWRNASRLDNVCSYGQHAQPRGDWRYVGAYPKRYEIVVDGKVVGAFADAPQFFALPAGRRDIKVVGYYCVVRNCTNNQVMKAFSVDLQPGEKKTLHRNSAFYAHHYDINITLQ